MDWLRFSCDCPIAGSIDLSYPILSYPILSYRILPYPILSYPILSNPILLSLGCDCPCRTVLGYTTQKKRPAFSSFLAFTCLSINQRPKMIRSAIFLAFLSQKCIVFKCSDRTGPLCCRANFTY
ncbi:hypothetical protein Y032_0462g1894 [Ancylostoma ceylanicum]|uniref:Uncharacterized protein n=1 Tax=Ancylostoma ceylanicum TaxID=53326 RepID=A0A016WXS6_9BILA|nr:hypothetical protein Y032_0462g1894 [Ancylostoma ceylanicum]